MGYYISTVKTSYDFEDLMYGVFYAQVLVSVRV